LWLGKIDFTKKILDLKDRERLSQPEKFENEQHLQYL